MKSIPQPNQYTRYFSGNVNLVKQYVSIKNNCCMSLSPGDYANNDQHPQFLQNTLPSQIKKMKYYFLNFSFKYRYPLTLLKFLIISYFKLWLASAKFHTEFELFTKGDQFKKSSFICYRCPRIIANSWSWKLCPRMDLIFPD